LGHVWLQMTPARAEYQDILYLGPAQNNNKYFWCAHQRTVDFHTGWTMRSHIVKRVYLGLKDEQLVGAGDTKNGVRGRLERLVRTASWLGKSFEKTAAKDAAKEYVEARQNASFKDDLSQKST